MRTNNKERYYRTIIHKAVEKGRIHPEDAEDINTYITRRVIQDHISPAHRTGMANACTKFAEKYFKGKTYRDITNSEWESAVDAFLTSDYTPKTKNYYLAVIRHFLEFEVKSGKNTHLDISLVKSVKAVKVPLKTKTEKDLISPEEVVKMLTYSKITKRDSALVALLYWTGCRIGEALSLRWEDIKFKPPVVELRIPPFKTNPERFVVTAEAMSYLAEWKNNYPKDIEGGAEGSNYVFVAKKSKAVGYHNYTFQSAYKMIRHLGQEVLGRDIHPHQFRASDITNKSKSGVSDMVNKIVHWGNVGTNMLTVYSIPSEEMIRDELLKGTGLVEVEKVEDISKPIQCPICGKVNVGVSYCGHCGTPLVRSAIENKARVDEELARINQNVSIGDMLSATAKYFGFTQDEFVDVFQKLLNSKR